MKQEGLGDLLQAARHAVHSERFRVEWPWPPNIRNDEVGIGARVLEVASSCALPMDR